MMDAEKRRYRFADFTLEASEHRLWRGDQEIYLPPKTFETLLYLVERHGRLVRKSELLAEIWADAIVTDNALSRCIKEVREALLDDAARPRYIKTIPRVGYKFIAKVKDVASAEVLEERDQDGAVDSVADTAGGDDQEIDSRAAIGASADLPMSESGFTAWRPVLWWGLGGLIMGALLAGAVVWQLMIPALSSTDSLVRLTIAIPPGAPLSSVGSPLALSPDGTRLVYVAEQDGDTQLYLRVMDRLEPTAIPGTKGAQHPFFSPDGESVGYFDHHDDVLKRVLLNGEKPVTLCEAQRGFGGSWGPDHTIIFTPDIGQGLWRISAAGGAPQAVTSLDIEKAEITHRWPEMLPGGQAVLFTSSIGGGFGNARIEVVSLKTGERKVLLEGATFARYVATGHLVFAHGGVLQAVPFDPERLEINGTPVTVLEGVKMDPALGASQFAFSTTGTLVYAPGNAQGDDRKLVWVTRDGRTEALLEPQRAYSYPRFSPDGRFLAVVSVSEDAHSDIWIVDVERGTLARLTFEGNNLMPVWTPDGKQVTFISQRNGRVGLYWKPVDGSGPAELLLQSQYPQVPHSWSPDGRYLALTEFRPDTKGDIWILPLEGERTPRLFLRTDYSEWGAMFSPDGRWIAYVSEESGPDHVYVRPFPGPGEKWQISVKEGREPVWGPSGRELFYRDWERVMVVPIQLRSAVAVGPPRPLIEGRFEVGEVHVFQNYDIAPDGRRFVMIRRQQTGALTQLNVVLNWLEELRRRVPRVGN